MMTRWEMLERAEETLDELVGDWTDLRPDRHKELIERHGDDDRAAIEELVKDILEAAIGGIQNHFEAEDFWAE